MSELMRASRQWATRPVDERFWSVADLAAHCNSLRTATKDCQLGQITARLVNDDVAIIGPEGNVTTPTNWGFAQLCRAIQAPAKYLAALSPRLAVDCLNEGLKGRTEKVKAFVQVNGNSVQLRAVTGPDYNRFYDKQLCGMLEPLTVSGWKVPPARPASNDDNRARPATADDLIPGMTGGAQVRVGETIAPSGVYRGDRDSFVFLVNPNKSIDDGGDGGMFKGIIASNSEVGNASLRFQGFCHEGVCGNHIIWGASEITEKRLIHRGRMNLTALTDWLGEWAGVDMMETENMIAAAKRYVLGKDQDEVLDRVYKLGLAALTQTAIKASYAYAEQWEHTAHANPNTAWGFVHGLTRYSQTLGFADARHALDLAGGKVLDLAV